MLTTLAVIVILIIASQTLKLIKLGAEDEKIIEEEKKKKNIRVSKIIDYTITVILSLIFVFFFSSSLFINCTENTYFENVPTYKVVKTDSMSKKNEKNTYLVENNLNDQIQSFDLIATYKIPEEKDLKLYDVVLYEVDDVILVHRIVGIEEPNKEHPNERYFLLQGDAIERPDRFPVRYEQMKGIYRGERVPFVGSFVLFMQSPAGWICMLLVAVAVVCTPILERKISKAKEERLLIINAGAVTVVEQDIQTPTVETEFKNDAVVKNNRFSLFGNRKDTRTFIEKLASADDTLKARYNLLNDTLLRFEKIRVIEGKTQHSYRCGNLAVARFTIRGKTLNIYLGLDPKEFENTKYIYTDVSAVNKHANYPMRIKLSSDRQARWANELILLFAKNNGITLLDKPQEVEIIENNEKAFNITAKDNRTFDQKLNDLPIAKERFDAIKELLERVNGVRVIESKKQKTYKSGNVALARFAVRGKTLNAYIALKPEEYIDTKYIYTDVSKVNKYANYPMRVKVSSDRQARWAKELLIEKINNSGLTLAEKKEEIVETPIEEKPFFMNFSKEKDERTFDQKLNDLPIAKERFEKIKEELLKISKIREIVGKKQRTFKVGNTPIIRFTVRGKTLNAYIALNPKEFENTKYIYTDVSAVNKHANYPMRVKVSSNRQVRWVIELILKIMLGEKV